MLEQQDLRTELDNGFREVETMKIDILRTILDHVKISTLAQFPFPMPPMYPPQPPQVVTLPAPVAYQPTMKPLLSTQIETNKQDVEEILSNRLVTEPEQLRKQSGEVTEQIKPVSAKSLSKSKVSDKIIEEPVPEDKDDEKISMVLSPDSEKADIDESPEKYDLDKLATRSGSIFEKPIVKKPFELIIDQGRFLPDNVN